MQPHIQRKRKEVSSKTLRLNGLAPNLDKNLDGAVGNADMRVNQRALSSLDFFPVVTSFLLSVLSLRPFRSISPTNACGHCLKFILLLVAQSK